MSTVSYFLQLIVLSAVLFLPYVLMLRKKKCYQFNRWYLVLIMFLSILLPLSDLSFAGSNEKSGILLMQYAAIKEQIMSAKDRYAQRFIAESKPAFNLLTVLKIAYAIIAGRFLCVIAVRLVKLRKLIAHSAKRKLAGIYIISGNFSCGPFSFMNYLFWDRSTNMLSAEGRMMLRHEFAHIQQKHFIDVLASEVVAALFWINPIFFFIRRELKNVHEFSADAFAMRGRNDKQNYATLLLQRSFDTTLSFHSFFSSPVKKRIHMLLHKSGNPASQIIITVAAAISVITAFAFNPKPQVKIRHPTVSEISKQRPGEKGSSSSDKYDKTVTDKRGDVEELQKKSEPFTLNTVVNYTSGTLVTTNIETEIEAPEQIANRSDKTQYVINTGKPTREAIDPEYNFPKMIVYPSRMYNELVIGADFKENHAYDPGWRLEVLLYNSDKQLVSRRQLQRERIDNLMVVKISFNQLPKDNYLLNVKSTDGIIKETYRINKDF